LKQARKARLGDWLDGFAICASAACLVHCLVLPLIIAALPAIARSIDPGEGFHRIVLALAIPTSGLALIPGWRSSGAIVPLAAGLAGLALLATGVALAGRPTVETVVSVAGSVLLATAHLLNWRRRRTHC
jgi:hypothetical protein